MSVVEYFKCEVSCCGWEWIDCIIFYLIFLMYGYVIGVFVDVEFDESFVSNFEYCLRESFVLFKLIWFGFKFWV